MIVFLNGEFVEEWAATVSVFDRSFQYGDGLFETMRIFNGKPFRWEQHMERLAAGAEYLRIQVPLERAAARLVGSPKQNGEVIYQPEARRQVDLRAAAERLVIENQMPDAILRVTISRGVGARGYSPKGAVRPTVVMSLHPAPASNAPAAWRLITSCHRLAIEDPLLRFKTANKLVQVLAKAEADDATMDDALLLNTRGEVCSASSANVFWIEGKRLFTPPVSAGALPGITRGTVLEFARGQGLDCVEDSASAARLREADGVFLTQSSRGVIEVVKLDGKPLKRSQVVEELRSTYAQLLARETSK